MSERARIAENLDAEVREALNRLDCRSSALRPSCVGPLSSSSALSAFRPPPELSGADRHDPQALTTSLHCVLCRTTFAAGDHVASCQLRRHAYCMTCCRMLGGSFTCGVCAPRGNETTSADLLTSRRQAQERSGLRVLPAVTAPRSTDDFDEARSKLPCVGAIRSLVDMSRRDLTHEMFIAAAAVIAPR